MIAFIFSEEKNFTSHLSSSLIENKCVVHVSEDTRSIPNNINYLFIILDKSKSLPAKIKELLKDKNIKSCIIAKIGNTLNIEEFDKVPVIYLGDDIDKDKAANLVIRKIFSFGFENRVTVIGSQTKIEVPFKKEISAPKKNKKSFLKIILLLVTSIFWVVCLPFILIIFSFVSICLSYF